MAKKPVLREASKIEITVLVDNYTDWLLIQGSDVVKRPVVPPGKTLLAEHGLSLLIKVHSASEVHTLIMDAGVTPVPLIQNLESLNMDLSGVSDVVLSHGHIDHFGGLTALLSRLAKGVNLTLHPDAFLERRMNIKPLGIMSEMPILSEASLKEAGAELHKETGASVLAGGLVLAQGEIARVTDFEKGFPWAEARVDGNWVTDPFRDDQGIVFNLENKGLVVIGGCSHAGIINTVRHAQNITGVQKVEAVLGGFHLTGPIFEPIIRPTILEMKKIAPRYIIPMHCTGWKAVSEFAAMMPEQFLLNTVGTTYVFQ